MEARIIAMTPNLLKVVWTAARTCYSAKSPAEIWDNAPSDEEMLRLVRQIIDSQHHSVVEHCAITFAVSGVSRTLLAQLTRHRIGISYSVQSQRYVSERSEKNDGQFEMVVPPTVMGNPEAREDFFAEMRRIQESYDRLCQLGVPKEDARFVLPGAAATNLVVTVNLRSLFDLFRKRVSTPGAQWEIKALIKEMANQVMEREPWLREFLS